MEQYYIKNTWNHQMRGFVIMQNAQNADTMALFYWGCSKMSKIKRQSYFNDLK